MIKQLPKTVRIKVTATDIKRGKRTNRWGCPVARAAMRAFRIPIKSLTQRIVVTYNGIKLPKYGLGCQYYLPQRALRFIRRFDLGCKVKPFEFTAKQV